MLKKDDAAPEFELVSDEGQKVKLADYRGRRVVLFFFPKAFTSGCTTQACGLRDRFPRLEAAGATVLGVSPDSPKQLAKWRKAEKLPYNLLSDADHAVAEAYGVWGEKSMYGRKYMGIIRSHFIIDAEGKIADAQVKVSPEDSVERAVAAVVA